LIIVFLLPFPSTNFYREPEGAPSAFQFCFFPSSPAYVVRSICSLCARKDYGWTFSGPWVRLPVVSVPRWWMPFSFSIFPPISSLSWGEAGIATPVSCHRESRGPASLPLASETLQAKLSGLPPPPSALSFFQKLPAIIYPAGFCSEAVELVGGCCPPLDRPYSFVHPSIFKTRRSSSQSFLHTQLHKKPPFAPPPFSLGQDLFSWKRGGTPFSVSPFPAFSHSNFFF